jgi:hypothetical protein
MALELHLWRRMSTPPNPKPPEQSKTRQRRYLIGAAVVLASAVTAAVILDRGGANRQENQGRSNESQSNKEGAVPATGTAR